MGGPETTLLLLQQQHALPSPESVGKALEGTKGYANMESHQSKPIRDKEGSAPTQQQEQEEKQQTKEGIVKLEALPTITKRFGHSCNSSSSRKNNSSSSGSSEQGRNNGQSTCELSAANEGSHSLAAPTLPPSAAAASTTALTTTVAPAPAVAALTLEQSAAALRNKLSSSSVAAGAQAEAAAEAATTQPLEATAAAEEPSREGPPAAGEAKAAASASASAADGAAAHVMCRAAEGLVELPEAASGSCCVSAASSAPRRRSRWRKARKASCFTSTKCNLGCGQSIERCCCNRDDRSARDLCNSRRHDNNSSNDSSKSSTYSCPSGPQAKLSIWHRCKDKLHRHRVRLGASTSRRSSITRSITTAAGAAAPPTRETERSPLEGDPLLLPGAAPTIAAASPVCAAIAEGCNDPLAKDHRQQQQEKERQCTESADAKHRGVAGNSSGLAVSPFGAESAINSKRCLVNASPVSATAACEAEQNQEAQQEQKQQQQSEPSQQQRQQQLPSITEGGPGAAIPGSTCSTTLTNQGSSPAVLLAQRQRKTDIVSVEVQRLGPQLLPPGTRSGTDGVALERMECHAAEESHRKVWFVPPLCCLAWNTKPRPFSAWDLRMSYRCLLPFTVLKLLRVLLCYLLPTLMHLGNERDRTPGEAGAVSGGAVDTAASALGENGQQHLLQRLLQLCCFFSLVLAMWGLAVVFVATRPLLKPFNIGWKFTCLKALVLFIQLLELAAEAFQPKSRTAVPADDDAAAATAAATAAAQRVYVFTFLELLGSAVCAVMATWAYKPGDLLDAHRRLVLLQQQLPKDATVDIGGSNSCRNRKCSSNRSSGRFNLVIPGKFATARKRCNFRSIWRRNVQTKSAEANLKDHCRQVAESP
ncbi:hypothetical protein, conserved [Eimeria tenella]|uniref:Uncharacterized protein n=1 Tax=Eimeria tenella TaxID=5802 RepID=U6KZL2_EIMTE|nr:hypothetical protein, conserved [Eimeria tenella]CDJ42373.1 hypothetical protein, conserved [Eimeria tenella]|eukprot:XP_013233123.1 hypothetical protein, conserved [Eimeria tenella]